MKVNKIWLAATIFCLSVALLMHLPFFGQLPKGLNRDEAALGYTAYSLLKTGKDEWGKSWPISILSFGDQKLPGYVYTLIPFIKFLGLTNQAIRLPSLLSGLTIIISMGILSLLLAKSFKWSTQKQLIFSTLTMLFLAISPWEMHFSRVAYEAHLALSYFLVGLVGYLLAIEAVKKTKYQGWLILLTTTAWSVCLLTYHSYQLFLPMFALGLLIIDWRKLKKLPPLTMLSMVVVGSITLWLLWAGGIFQANLVKNRGITPLSSDHLLSQATGYRSALPLPGIVNKLLFNKATEGSVVLAQNYLSSFSLGFLFAHGSNHGDHNPGNINNLNLFIAPLLILGFLGLKEFKSHHQIKRLFLWFVLALVPSALTNSPLHEVRELAIFPLLELIAAFGFTWGLFKFVGPKWRLWTICGLIIIMVLSGLRTFITYIYLVPPQAVNNQKYILLARALAKYQQVGLEVITQSPSSSPYVWYLIENKTDPSWVQDNLVHFPPTSEGFIHVRKLGNITFETINLGEIYQQIDIKPVIVILRPEEMAFEQSIDKRWTSLEKIFDDQGKLVYEVWEVAPEDKKITIN